MKKFLSVVCLAALFSSSVNANDNIAEFELGINDSNNIDVILKVKEDLKINNIIINRYKYKVKFCEKEFEKIIDL